MICLTFEVNLLFHSIFPCFILYDSIANLGRTHLPKATSLFNVTIDSFLISNFFVNEFFLAYFAMFSCRRAKSARVNPILVS